MIAATIRSSGYDPPPIESMGPANRRAIAIATWNHLKTQETPTPTPVSDTDADGDGKVDAKDPLPFTVGVVSWKTDPLRDGLPDSTIGAIAAGQGVAFNFTSLDGSEVPGFRNDVGAAFSDRSGFGWRGDLTSNTRLRGLDDRPIRDGFVFTRQRDVWECQVANRRWQVHVCLGDAGHDQSGQHLQIEEVVVAENIATRSGGFYELETEVQVDDGKLTLTLGKSAGGSNTCLNWLLAIPVDPEHNQTD